MYMCIYRCMHLYILQRNISLSVVQCVAVCCSVLQCVSLCCSVLQCVAVCFIVLQCVAVRCSVFHCVAVCFIVLQYVSLYCSVKNVLSLFHDSLIHVRNGKSHQIVSLIECSSVIYIYKYDSHI